MSQDPRQEKPGSPPRSDPPKGWVEKFAERSAGLPPPPAADQPAKKDESANAAWSLAGKGIQFAATVGFLALLGWYLDRRFGWMPWGIVGFTMVGVVGGLYLLIKEALSDNQK